MRKPDKPPTPIELAALVVALFLAVGVAGYFGNIVAAIAVAIAVAIAGCGFFYRRT